MPAVVVTGSGGLIGSEADHRCWISDLSEFRRDYSDWEVTKGIEDTLREIYDQNVDAWVVAA